ncbi:MAG: hypothetical protein ACE5MI_09950 [Acidimicrobiia bacterium]
MKASRKALWMVALAVAATACTTSEPASDQSVEQAQAAAQLADSLAGLQATITDTQDELASVEDGLDQAEVTVSAFVTGTETHLLDRTADIPDPPDGQVAVRLSFGYLPEPLPGVGLVAFEPDPAVNSLWAMESLPAGSAIPVGDPIPDSTIFLAPGEKGTVTLAYENPSSEDRSFIVAPHQDSPGSLNGKLWPTCLCMSFVYEAPANGAWYRVIEIGVSPDVAPGSKADILWTVNTDESVLPES